MKGSGLNPSIKFIKLRFGSHLKPSSEKMKTTVTEAELMISIFIFMCIAVLCHGFELNDIIL